MNNEICTCYENILSQAKERIIDHESKRFDDYQVEDIDFLHRFKGFFLGQNTQPERIQTLFHRIEYHYSWKKKNGERSATKSQTIDIAISYCPFCGKLVNLARSEGGEG